MCSNKGKIVFQYHIEDKDEKYTFEKSFLRPPELTSYCPHCHGDNVKKVSILNKYVMNQIYDENMTYIHELGLSRVIKAIKPIFTEDNIKDEDFVNNTMKKLIIMNIDLREILAEKMLDDHKTIYWDNIIITAPYLRTSIKNKLKNEIKYMQTINEIKNYLNFSKCGVVTEFVFKKDKKIILFTLLKNKEDKKETSKECQICYTEFKDYNALCNTCIDQDICEECEKNTKSKYNRCPFCNTEYENNDFDDM
jgi:hypothetical protein